MGRICVLRKKLLTLSGISWPLQLKMLLHLVVSSEDG